MSRKRPSFSLLLSSLMVLAVGAPLLAGPLETSAPTRLQRLRLPLENTSSQSLWTWNLGDRPVEVKLGTSFAIRLMAGSFLEAPELRSAHPRIPVDSQVVLIAASRDFDPSAFEFDLRGTVRQMESDQGLSVQVNRPEWARQLLVQTAAGRSFLAPGQTRQAAMEIGPDGRARVALGLVEKNSAVVVSLKDKRGSVIRSFSIASPVPVRVRADFGFAAEVDDAQVLVRVARGRAVVETPTARGGLKTTYGTASFSSNLIFSGSYTFSVDNGPANTCGELNIYRNGTWEFTGSWLCTDGSGDATKGPWYWSDKASDETGEPVFIRWPNTTATSSTFVIIDKHYANTYIDSPTPTNSTPTSYYGHATDATWGTGFDFGYASFSIFQNLSTGKYWDPSTLQYNSNSPVFVTPSFLSQSGRWYLSWGGSTFPAVGAHVTGQQYRWYTCISDAGYGNCTGNYDFTAN